MRVVSGAPLRPRFFQSPVRWCLYRVSVWLTALLCVILYIAASAIPMMFGVDMVTATLAGNLLATVFALASLYFHWFGIKSPAATRPIRKKTYVCWALMFVLAAILLESLFCYLDARIEDPGMAVREQSIDEVNILGYLFLAVFSAPVAEEALSRVFLYNMMRSRCHRITAMLVAGLIFAALHVTMVHMVVATLLSCMLVFAYEATGKWFVPVMGHFIYNFFVLFVYSSIPGLQALAESSVFIAFDVAAISLMLCLTGWYVWRRRDTREASLQD